MAIKTVQIPLVNGGFEEGVRPWHDIGEVRVAIGWDPWWEAHPDSPPGELHRPEYYVESKRVRSGLGQQTWYTTSATHNAGIYQAVSLPPNVLRLKLSAFAQYHSRHTDGSGGGFGCVIGLDTRGVEWQAGARPALPAEIDWSLWRSQYDKDPPWDGATWHRFTLDIEGPFSQQAVVILRSACQYKAKANYAFWDDVELWADVEEEDTTLPGTLIEAIREAKRRASELDALLYEILEELG